MFLSRYIESVEQMKILRYAVENEAAEWTVEDVYRTILTNRESIANRARAFAVAEILREIAGETARYRFRPGRAELEEAARESLGAYKERSALVIETTFKRKADQAKHFAEAF